MKPVRGQPHNERRLARRDDSYQVDTEADTQPITAILTFKKHTQEKVFFSEVMRPFGTLHTRAKGNFNNALPGLPLTTFSNPPLSQRMATRVLEP